MNKDKSYSGGITEITAKVLDQRTHPFSFNLPHIFKELEDLELVKELYNKEFFSDEPMEEQIKKLLAQRKKYKTNAEYGKFAELSLKRDTYDILSHIEVLINTNDQNIHPITKIKLIKSLVGCKDEK